MAVGIETPVNPPKIYVNPLKSTSKTFNQHKVKNTRNRISSVASNMNSLWYIRSFRISTLYTSLMHKLENIEYTTRLIKCCNLVCIITHMLRFTSWRYRRLAGSFTLWGFSTSIFFLTSVCVRMCAYVCVHESTFRQKFCLSIHLSSD